MDEGAKGGGGMIEGRNDLKWEKSSFIVLGCKLLKQNIPPIYVRPHSGNRGPWQKSQYENGKVSWNGCQPGDPVWAQVFSKMVAASIFALVDIQQPTGNTGGSRWG